MQRDRTLRTMQLAISCISNIAAYRANWHKINGVSKLIVDRDFWVRMNGNFLDVAVLEWCKLFADKSGKHHWSCTFKNKNAWKKDLFENMAMSQTRFKKELKLVSDYRNKYVAHLDDPIAMNYPYTEFMLNSVYHLHDCLKTNAQTKRFFVGNYEYARELFARRIEAANDEVRFSLATENEFIAQRTRFTRYE
jgi:hypothetical protein